MRPDPSNEMILFPLRRRWIAAIALLSALPFLFVRIPPLIDVPGHIGRYAVELAPPGSPMLRYFAFHWVPAPNLAADLLVVPLARLLGLVPAVWLLCAIIPGLTVGALLMLARRRNPGGAGALPWALLFVYNLWFLYGFLNFFLVAALSLWAVLLWEALDKRRRLRAALFVLLTPVLFVGHAVGALLMVVWIASLTLAARLEAGGPGALRDPRAWIAAAGSLWPLASGALLLAVAPGGGGVTRWDFLDKLDAVATALQDQNRWLDLASVVAALAVFVLGWIWRARLRGGNALIVVATLALFVAAPGVLGGAARVDGRLLPFVPMLAFVLQDWREVRPAQRRWTARVGWMLLLVRFTVTTVSFAGYAESYQRELAALDHVAVGSRVLNLSLVNCRGDQWRRERTEHLANLATPLRQAWVNAHWTNGALQLLQVTYQPRGYAHDPSQLIVGEHCVDRAVPFERRSRHGLVESLPRLPLDQVDYLWLIGTDLPPGVRDPRLVPVWRSGRSALYAVRGGATT